ncbi:MAG: acetyl-CoA hydrolase/transferase family protein [Ruminococcaceae bacterium]|nr:acetyl-CoA hydrolase/transferase family protein [Oscillospiraceae bacterium]
MTHEELFKSKLITAEQAISMIKSGDTITCGQYGNEPRTILRRLHTLADRIDDLTVFCDNPSEDYPFFSDPAMEGKVKILTSFMSGNIRKHHDNGRFGFVPVNLHSLSTTIVDNYKPDVFIAAVAPLDKYGYICVSMSQMIELAMMDHAELIICEVNPNIPHTHGTVRIPIEQVDYFIETDGDITTLPDTPVTEEQKAIGGYVASLINNGDTIQMGIGGMPNAVAAELGCKKNLGVHTEMFGSAMGKLMASGVINNSRKNFHRGTTVASFAWGDQGLYDYMDNNPMIEMLPVSYVNDPTNIAANNNMVSVNTALQIDLTGQVCSESIGYRQYSGIGGAFDFTYGAYHSKGGRSIIAINSTAKNGTISRIQPFLNLGAVVSIPRTIVDYIVTEYGIAKLRGMSVRQRVDGLISIAHPDFRDELRFEANKAMLW